MFFETVAYIADTYMWFLIAALVIGIVTGWVAAGDDDKTPTGQGRDQ